LRSAVGALVEMALERGPLLIVERVERVRGD
jgi:hypothetical protein